MKQIQILSQDSFISLNPKSRNNITTCKSEKPFRYILKTCNSCNLFFSHQIPFLIPAGKHQKKQFCFQTKTRESLQNLLGWVKLHRASLICLPGRNRVLWSSRGHYRGLHDRHGVWWKHGRLSTFHNSVCSYVWDRLQQAQADLLTRSRIKGSGVLNSNGSSGMGLDALVTATTALS